MVRILNILNSLDIGGMEKLVVRLANTLDDTGFEPHICCINEVSTIAKDFGRPDRLFVLGNVGRINAKSIASILRYIKSRSIDVIHAHNTAGLIYGFWPSVVMRKPIIYTLHGLERDYESKSLINRVERWLSNRVSAYVCVSRQLAEYMSTLLAIDRDRMAVIYNGVDLKRNEVVRPSSKNVIIGSVGRLSPVKNYELLVKASRKIISEFSECEFTVLGGGEEYDSLVQLRDSFGLGERVIFTGPVDDVDAHLEEFDIFVLTSLSEGISLSILEAMSMGKVCVASNVGGNMEIINDKENGFIFRSNDENDLIETLRMVIRDIREPWMNDVRRKARQTISDKFSLTGMAAKYGALYEKLASA